jgi:hypothetical protein
MGSIKNFAGLIMVCLCFCQPLSAQHVNIKMGEVHKGHYSSILKKILLCTDDGLYALAESSGKEWLEKYDNHNVLVFSHKLPMKSPESASMKFEKLYFVEDRFIMLTSCYNFKTLKLTAYATPISLQGEKMDKPKAVGIISEDLNKLKGFFISAQAYDRSSFLICGEEAYDDPLHKKFFLKVWDKECNPLWERELDNPFDNKDFDFSDIALVSKSKVCCLARVTSQTAKNTEDRTYRYSLLMYTENKEKESSLDLGGRSITEARFTTDDDGNILCSGFFIDNSTEKGTNGVFLVKLNGRNGSILTQTTVNFDDERAAALRASTNVKDLQVRSIFTRGDSGVFVVAEEYVVTPPSYGSGVYFSGTNVEKDLLVSGFNSKGELEWTKRIIKKQYQVTADQPSNSWAQYIDDNQLIFIYDADKEEINEKTRKKNPDGVNNTAVLVTSINNAGILQQKTALNNADQKVFLQPGISRRCGKHEMIMFASYGHLESFATITVE